MTYLRYVAAEKGGPRTFWTRSDALDAPQTSLDAVWITGESRQRAERLKQASLSPWLQTFCWRETCCQGTACLVVFFHLSRSFCLIVNEKFFLERAREVFA